MFRHILIPTDGSDLSRKAMLYGIQLAKATGAKVTVLTVRPRNTVTSMDVIGVVASQAEFDEEGRLFAENVLTQAEIAAEAAGVPIETLHEVHEQPFQAIIASGIAFRCDLILMASHGRSAAAALLLGSETTKVLSHSLIPVLVYR